jgi:hypothetical protein
MFNFIFHLFKKKDPVLKKNGKEYQKINNRVPGFGVKTKKKDPVFTEKEYQKINIEASKVCVHKVPAKIDVKHSEADIISEFAKQMDFYNLSKW